MDTEYSISFSKSLRKQLPIKPISQLVISQEVEHRSRHTY